MNNDELYGQGIRKGAYFAVKSKRRQLLPWSSTQNPTWDFTEGSAGLNWKSLVLLYCIISGSRVSAQELHGRELGGFLSM